MKKQLLGAAVATAMTAGFVTAPAQALEVSGNVALTSDYRFRGISQSDENPAVQGGFDVAFDAGFYIGTWGSVVDFSSGDNETGKYGSLELDYYAGWAGNIGDTEFGIDVAYYYYDYPGDTVDPEGDYQEFYVGTSWRDLGLSVTYSDDYFAETDEFWYISGDYSFSILDDGLSIGLHVGYNIFEDDSGFFADDTDDYTDYSVSVTYNWMDVDFSVAWVGTDLDNSAGYGDLADDTAVFTIAKSL